MVAIYTIRCTANGKVYVGSAVDINRRWKEHRHELRNNKHYNQRLQRAWNKYGESAFVFEVVETCKPSEILLREQHWIDVLRAADKKYGFNILPKAYSHLGAKRPSGTGAKISTALKARGIRPVQPPHYRHSEETRRKISAVQKGRKHSPETIEKRASKLRGRKQSPEHSEKVRLANLGKRRSPESRKKMSESQRNVPRSVRVGSSNEYILTSPTGEVYKTTNLSLFCEEHGLVYSSALSVAGGHRNSVYGWTIVKGKRS